MAAAGDVEDSTTAHAHAAAEWVPDDGGDCGTLTSGEASQSGVLKGENKSLLWSLLKQVRPGMDASRIILPTFVLEPRSFLDKFSDAFYHCDLLANAARAPRPADRILLILQWYFTAFYKKPKGLQKPYNPLLGEVFRAIFETPESAAHAPASRTFLVTEQVAHRPPTTAIFCSNRPAGWVLEGTFVGGSRFFGNTALSIHTAELNLHLLPCNEVYRITMPNLQIRGIMLGTMFTELVGHCEIACASTQCRIDIEFKAKPTFGGSANHVEGHVLHNLPSEPAWKFDGKWDEVVHLKTGDKEKTVIFANTPDLHARRLRRLVVATSHQEPFTEAHQGHFESARTWQPCSIGILTGDQQAAAKHKNYLEDAQRAKAKILEDKKEEFQHHFFENVDGKMRYKHLNVNCWDPAIEAYEFEVDGVIRTQKNPPP